MAVIITGHGLRAIFVTVLATTALLQIGYIFGCVVRVYAEAYLQARTSPRYGLSRSGPAISSQLVRIGIEVLFSGRDDLRPADHSWSDAVQRRSGMTTWSRTRNGHLPA